MATTGVERRRARRCAAPLLLALSAGCASGSRPVERPRVNPVPTPPAVRPDPEIRIGLTVGAPAVSLGGGDALVANQPDGSRVTTIPPGQTWRATAAGHRLTLISPAGWISPPLEAVTIAAADPAGVIRLNGRLYRGLADLLPDDSGVTLVNRLGLEAYLLGVVSAEMGRRNLIEVAALRAQAVVSRTFALRNLGKWKARGFDLTATFNDQVYGGLAAETPEGREAVTETRGRVLTFNGRPIEAFFYSTCGGRTADGTEVFSGAAEPYLRSIPDEDASGAAYCRISPRYRWRAEWDAEALRSTLTRYLPPTSSLSRDDLRQILDIRITRRTISGRVAQMAIGLSSHPEIRIEGPAIRRVLRPTNGELLRSNSFTLTADGAGRRVTHLALDGMGAGHAVGFCQWGAVGRAREGQGYERILAAYFPGTQLERRY